MPRKRSGHTQASAVGVRNVDRACVKMKPVLDRASAASVRPAIFEIAHDRRSKGSEMHTNLVRPSRHRLRHDPRELIARPAQYDIVGDRMARTLAVLVCRRHALVAPARAET